MFTLLQEVTTFLQVLKGDHVTAGDKRKGLTGWWSPHVSHNTMCEIMCLQKFHWTQEITAYSHWGLLEEMQGDTWDGSNSIVKVGCGAVKYSKCHNVPCKWHFLLLEPFWAATAMLLPTMTSMVSGRGSLHSVLWRLQYIPHCLPSGYFTDWQWPHFPTNNV